MTLCYPFWSNSPASSVASSCLRFSEAKAHSGVVPRHPITYEENCQQHRGPLGGRPPEEHPEGAWGTF